jgi:hypothetical protein
VAAAGCFFLFLFARENGLERISGLGYLREINLGLKALGCTRGTCRGARSTAKMGADFFRFVIFNGAGVGHLGVTKAHLSQQIQNLPALDLYFSCQIVDSNLTHPPLFDVCCR